MRHFWGKAILILFSGVVFDADYDRGVNIFIRGHLRGQNWGQSLKRAKIRVSSIFKGIFHSLEPFLSFLMLFVILNLVISVSERNIAILGVRRGQK